MSPRYGTPGQLADLLRSHLGILADEPPEAFEDPLVRAEAERLRDLLDRQLGRQEQR